jgi:hypothetical protein
MLGTKESIDFFTNLLKSLSSKRFSGYSSAKGSQLDAFAKYLWNVNLCESLYPCFQLLEIAFRNKVHFQIGAAIGDPTWLINQHGFIHQEDQDAIKKGKESLATANSPITEDYLVSEMKFGFWTTLLNSRYERLWPRIITPVFPNMPNTMRTRADASILMNRVRHLRNEALHHHSIWHWGDLKDRHKQMRSVIDYICAPSSAIAREIDRFPIVHSNGMAECLKAASRILKSVQKPEELAAG